MARPKKHRYVGCLPRCQRFKAMDSKNQIEAILSIDAFETIRLIDYEGRTQEEAALIMGVARTTVQRLYQEARKVLATFIMEGKQLKIDGGSFIMEESSCCKKNESIKRIAVSQTGNNISDEFTPCDAFHVYTYEAGKIENLQKILYDGQRCRDLFAQFYQANITVLFTGKIKEKNWQELERLNIQVFPNIQASPEEAIRLYESGKLKKDLTFKPHTCKEHEHHHEHGHEHGCCNNH
jgi:predicted DNA-binding protein (UPF0251 family)/predicted Fe-Mo cluster-binding NifX family protein